MKTLFLIALCFACVFATSMQKDLESPSDVCNSLKQQLPNCTFSTCTPFSVDYTCPFNLVPSVSFSIEVTLYVCATPPSLSFSLTDDGSIIFSSPLKGSGIIQKTFQGLWQDSDPTDWTGLDLDVAVNATKTDYNVEIWTQACAANVGWSNCWPSPGGLGLTDITIAYSDFCSSKQN